MTAEPSELLRAGPAEPPASPRRALRRGGRPRGQPGRGAGRPHARRARVGGQPLLRRSRCRLAGDGPVLRAGQEAARPAVGVDEGHLPAPHDPKPGGGAGRGRPGPGRRAIPQGPGPAVAPPSWCGQAGDPASTRQYIAVRNAAAPVLPRVFLPRRTCRRPGLRLDLRRLGSGRHLPAVGRCSVARGFVGPVHFPILAKWVLDRPVETAGVPHLESGLRPLLDRQDADPRRTRWRSSSARRCTCCTCGRWGPGSGAASSSCPRQCRCAPTC